MTTDFKTCEICGIESVNDGTGVWAVLADARDRWVHRGPCFQEYACQQRAGNTSLRLEIEQLGNALRHRAAVQVADERAHIREELLRAFHPYALDSNASIGTAESFVDELDRICPEEP